MKRPQHKKAVGAFRPLERGLQRPIAAGRVRVQPTARLHGEVGGLLHGLHGEITGRLDDDRALAADPRDNRRSVFVIMTPAGLALLTTPTCSAPQRLLPALRRLPLVASGMVEIIGFDGAFELVMHLVGHGRIAQPPAPPIARPDMDPHLPRNTSGRTGEAQQKGGEYPV
jgi:hypothetical protein